MRSTWCVISPGYPKQTLRAIRNQGNELGFHYNALPKDNKTWSEKEFRKQFKEITKLFNGKKPVTNKNHYTCWKGDTEFYQWCERCGIRIDQSRGPSKTGDVGFPFGTCHPHFPVDAKGRIIDVLELPFLTQDLVVTVPSGLVDSLLRAVYKHHGILHLLFHPHHIRTAGVEQALLYSLKKARDKKMEWWKAEDINAWERARRRLKWIRFQRKPSGISVRIYCKNALEGACLLFLSGKSFPVKIRGQKRKTRLVRRWGFSFASIVFNGVEGASYDVEICGDK